MQDWLHLHEGFFFSNTYSLCLVQNKSVHVHASSCTFTYSNMNAWIPKFRTFRNTAVAKKLRHRHGELYDTKQFKCEVLKGNNSLIAQAHNQLLAGSHKCTVGYVIKQALQLKIWVFWNVTLDSWASSSRRLEGSQCVHLHNHTVHCKLELSVLLGYCAAWLGDRYPTFRGSMVVPPSRVECPSPCPKTSETKHPVTRRRIPGKGNVQLQRHESLKTHTWTALPWTWRQ